MVSGLTSLEEGMPNIYVMPNPVNQRLSFHETINQMKSVSLGMEMHVIPQFFVEDHDDLVDALVYLILGISQEGIQSQEVISIL